MTHYRYVYSKIIDEVVFRKTENGAIRAYLQACKDATPDQLHDVLQHLKASQFECVPFTENGKHEVEIRGFKKEENLLNALGAGGWIKGPAYVTTPPEEKVGWLGMLKKRALQASGLAFVFGDINFFNYGRKQAQWEEMLAGVMYAGGTVSLLAYGRNDQSELQIKDLAKKITDHLIDEGAKMRPDTALLHTSREEPKGVFGIINDTFQRYPSEMFGLFTAFAGVMVAAGAARHKLLTPSAIKLDKQGLKIRNISGWLDVGLGTMTLLSSTLAGLVKEKAHDPDKPYSPGVQGILEWVQERPLAIASYGLMISTALHAISTRLDYTEAVRLNKPAQEKSAIANRAYFVISNLVAEGLMSIASKGHGEGVQSDNSVDATVISLTADMIVKQPAAKQQELVDHMVSFLGRPDVLAMKDNDVRQELTTRLEAMRTNPWAKAEDVSGTAPLAPIDYTVSPAIPPMTASTAPDASWLGKMAARTAAAAQGKLGASPASLARLSS